MSKYFVENELSSGNAYWVRVSENRPKTNKVHLSDEK
jgi:hypothetical protein